ncbi:hypothetical protein Glove_13g185 [Diversispora epigaea]|uniref:NYN domain-containing protein n=1 Tax=Diversispora epigaea TaxID=1348612 RepID=A0A397JP02_9GLOM|nr:hypothetical protein Glove_13g185 [Diversispora epigaea]
MANIKDYNTEELIEYLRKKNLKLNESHFGTLRVEEITGSSFLELTIDGFCSIGFMLGPATELIKFIAELKKCKHTSDFEKAGSFDYYRDSHIINQLHLDHGRLLSTILHDRKIGTDPVIVGFCPPDDDEIWSQVERLGFVVNVFDRNCVNKEKQADTYLISEGVDIVKTDTPGILVLVAGDRDYCPLITKALKYNWKIEIWFWSSGISGFLKSLGTFYCLDYYYKCFTYAREPIEILDCHISLKIFWWWYKEDKDCIVNMYFDDKEHLIDAKNWLKGKYSDSIQFWETVQERKKRNSFKCVTYS